MSLYAMEPEGICCNCNHMIVAGEQFTRQWCERSYRPADTYWRLIHSGGCPREPVCPHCRSAIKADEAKKYTENGCYHAACHEEINPPKSVPSQGSSQQP